MATIKKLLDIMKALRDPKSGCPWDLQQDFSSVAPYTIEEAYEVADAINREHWSDLRDELGDLLLQVVFHTQMASERDFFDFADVVDAIADKMTRRHPHVFAGAPIESAQDQHDAWADHKQAERDKTGSTGVLSGVARALPALMRADKLSRRAARVGFDWPDAERVREKVDEELAELDEARGNNDQAAITEELGDLLVATVTLARHLNVDPEKALRAGNDKFVRRFEAMEKIMADKGEDWPDLNLEDMENRWQQVKRSE